MGCWDGVKTSIGDRTDTKEIHHWRNSFEGSIFARRCLLPSFLLSPLPPPVPSIPIMSLSLSLWAPFSSLSTLPYHYIICSYEFGYFRCLPQWLSFCNWIPQLIIINFYPLWGMCQNSLPVQC